MAAPSEQEKDVARDSKEARSSDELPKTKDVAGTVSGKPGASALSTSAPFIFISPFTETSISSPPLAKTFSHRGFGRCTTANGTPEAAMAGTTNPKPSRPAPKCT
jgi:hypothetical protein